MHFILWLISWLATGNRNAQGVLVHCWFPWQNWLLIIQAIVGIVLLVGIPIFNGWYKAKKEAIQKVEKSLKKGCTFSDIIIYDFLYTMEENMFWLWCFLYSSLFALLCFCLFFIVCSAIESVQNRLQKLGESLAIPKETKIKQKIEQRTKLETERIKSIQREDSDKWLKLLTEGITELKKYHLAVSEACKGRIDRTPITAVLYSIEQIESILNNLGDNYLTLTAFENAVRVLAENKIILADAMRQSSAVIEDRLKQEIDLLRASVM